MRLTVEPQDHSPVLGPPIREQKPAPAPVPVAPGVIRNADGKLETVIAPPPPVWHPMPVVHIDETCDFGGFPVLAFEFSEAERRALADFSAWIESELTAALVMGLPTKLIDSGDTTD